MRPPPPGGHNPASRKPGDSASRGSSVERSPAGGPGGSRNDGGIARAELRHLHPESCPRGSVGVVRRFLGLLAVAAVAIPVGYAGAEPTRYGVGIQKVFDDSGNPVLVANFWPDGGLATPRFSICPPPDGTACSPAGRDNVLEPGAQPAGTVFEASASYRGHRYASRTDPWRGTVQSTVPPRLAGRPRVGARVAARAGSWRGGWGTEFDFGAVEACRTRAARHCVTLSAEGEDYPGSGRDPVVGSWYDNTTSTIGSRLIGVPARGFKRGVLRVVLHVGDGPGIRGTSRLVTSGPK